MLVPVTKDAGITTVAYGLQDALVSRSVRAEVLPELENDIVEMLLSKNQQDDLLEKVVAACDASQENKDVLITRGFSLHKPYAQELNFAVATALNAAIIFVAAANVINTKDLQIQTKIVTNSYKSRYQFTIFGIIFNKIESSFSQRIDFKENSFYMDLAVLGLIPQRNELSESESAFHAEKMGSLVSKFLEVNWMWPYINSVVEERLTPPRFKYHLLKTAGQLYKKIVLPEGDEPRTLQAANICAEKKIAHCILIGNKNAIAQAAANINLKLSEQIEIIDPDIVREKYVAPLVELRKSKGLTPEEARKQLQDNVVLGTMMIQLGDADGLVSGAVHSTANTIRPALQIIKTVPTSKLVSSVFFMCLPDQVLVFGDCAINPSPTAEELADIAVQSAESAQAFGINPRVAMLSYSTGTSGAGADVEKVKAAVEIAKIKRPDLAIDGPLQYDAAVMPDVAALKAPNSKVAGKANVFIFPDLNAGNITYKAVQRSTGIICIGPMLQGLRKPVNDLSRGCLVEDIVYTIALTAVQQN